MMDKAKEPTLAEDYEPKLRGKCPGCLVERRLYYVKIAVGLLKVCDVCRKGLADRGLLIEPERVYPMEGTK